MTGGPPPAETRSSAPNGAAFFVVEAPALRRLSRSRDDLDLP